MKNILLTLTLIVPLFVTAQNNSSHSFDNVVISLATKHTNYFFEGVENQFSVVVENVPCAEIYVKTEDGILKGESCKYTFNPEKKKHTACFSIYHITAEDTILLTSLEKRVRDIPEPVPVIVGKRDCKVDSTFFEIGDINPKIHLWLRDFLGTITFSTTRFSIMIFREGKPYYWNKFKGHKLPDELMSKLKKIKPGDNIVFYDIHYSGPTATDELLDIHFVYFEVVEKSELKKQQNGLE
ncbi:MAG: hypothetical protein K9I29_02575 [Bacteroidales bacterium]|nr:hypothetical protein [Bacteroidales bacterium]MCF8327152.1 hypothetical protein [Bacteroidales bacterium]